MRDEKIDIHQTERNYALAKSRLEVDERITPNNKNLIVKYLDDCALGKASRRRARVKSVGVRARLKNLYLLRIIALYFGPKLFTELNVEDVERLIRALNNNEILKLDGMRYSEETKSNMKKRLKMFLRWLFGEESKKFHDMTYWIDTRFQRRTMPSLEESEVRDLLLLCTTLRQKVIIACLFDSGFRIEEFLNVRNSDVFHIAGDASYYRVRVREEFSKSQGRDVPMFWPDSYDLIHAWMKSQQGKDNPDDLFFPSTYAAVLMTLKRIGRKVGKNLYPHLFRHSSATYYANQGLSEFQMNKRFGWSAASDMGRRYVEQAKILLEGEKQVKEYEEYKLGSLKGDLQKQVQENHFLRETVEAFRDELEKQKHELAEFRIAMTRRVADQFNG